MNPKIIIDQAFDNVLKQRGALTQALLIPFLLYMAIGFLPLVGIVIQSIIAITTHRIILLGAEAVPKWGIMKWSKRETIFLLYTIGAILVIFPVAAPFALVAPFIPYIGFIIPILVYIWLLARFSLIFPGIAIDQGITLKLSWKLTEQYQLLMVSVVIVFPILFALPAIFIGMIPHMYEISNLLITFAIYAISNLLATLATVFTVTTLSVSYNLICRDILNDREDTR